MKLFYTKKQVQRVLEEEVERHRVSSNTMQEYIGELLNENHILENKNKILKKETQQLFKSNCDLSLKNNELKLKVREINGAKGGLTKQINKLQEKLTEAEIKLSQRFILKEVATKGRPRKTQTMGIKSGTKTSKIIKKVKNDN